MLNEAKIIGFAETLDPRRWYTPVELSEIWDVNNKRRLYILSHMRRRDMTVMRGKTSKIQYKLQPRNRWRVTGQTKETAAPPLSAVITKKPDEQKALNDLIAATAAVGTANEVLRNKLDRIRAILDEV